MKKKGLQRKRQRREKRAHAKGRRIMGGQAVTQSQAIKKVRQSLSNAKSALFKRAQRKKLKQMRSAGKPSLGSDVEIDENSALAELDAHLDAIRDTVSESERESMVESVSNKLLEGLKEIHDAATGYYESIAQEINEDEYEVDEDDARVAIGRHFEGIAQDAYAVAEQIAEGQADLHDAADDMQALAADLADALEATKGID